MLTFCVMRLCIWLYIHAHTALCVYAFDIIYMHILRYTFSKHFTLGYETVYYAIDYAGLKFGFHNVKFICSHCKTDCFAGIILRIIQDQHWGISYNFGYEASKNRCLLKVLLVTNFILWNLIKIYNFKINLEKRHNKK